MAGRAGGHVEALSVGARVRAARGGVVQKVGELAAMADMVAGAPVREGQCLQRMEQSRERTARFDCSPGAR